MHARSRGVLADCGGKNGDEGSGESPFREKLPQIIGDGENRVEGVRGPVVSKVDADKGLAYVAEETRPCRAEHRPAVSGHVEHHRIAFEARFCASNGGLDRVRF